MLTHLLKHIYISVFHLILNFYQLVTIDKVRKLNINQGNVHCAVYNGTVNIHSKLMNLVMSNRIFKTLWWINGTTRMYIHRSFVVQPDFQMIRNETETEN